MVVYITKIAIFIPVRLGSTRLPKKPLIQIKGRTYIEHLIDRAKTAKLPDLIVLCTTIKPEDKIFGDIARENGIECFKGSEHDILKRFFDAADEYGLDFIVDVDGDDVFCDPELMDQTVDAFLETGASFLKWNNLPLGASPNGVKVEALNKVCEIKETHDTETGWGAYFTDTGLFNVKYLEPDDELKHPEIRMTLDYPEDLKFMKEIFNKLYVPGKMFTLRDILNLLKEEPAIVEINKGVNEKYWKRFEKLAEVKLRTAVQHSKK